MHESTVSRVTTQQVRAHAAGHLRAEVLLQQRDLARRTARTSPRRPSRAKIKELVDAEDAKHPHSDQKIVELLKKGGIDIARRTVAKYREQLGILQLDQAQASVLVGCR